MVDQLLAAGEAATPMGDFAGWMASEQRRVYLLCQRMLGDSDDADTATQDAFLKAYLALEKGGDGIEDLTRWITRIAVNTCLDRLRSRKWHFWRKRPSPEDEELILAMAPAGAPDQEDQLFATQIGWRLAAALDKLSDRQRAVFTLRHYDDLSLGAIAEMLDLDVGTVKAHMARALSKLREELKDLYALRQRDERGKETK